MYIISIQCCLLLARTILMDFGFAMSEEEDQYRAKNALWPVAVGNATIVRLLGFGDPCLLSCAIGVVSELKGGYQIVDAL